MLIDDLINMDDVATEIAVGYVTERAHPEFPELRILNYTDRCQFDRHWTPVTTQTRGLIYNAETRRLVARPFAKFFNYGDTANTGQLDPDMPILSAHDKIDGSLGIGYLRPDGKAAIATRGSFSSEQALHATERLDEEIAKRVNLGAIHDYTPLWEIVYPANRIVLDYGERDELVALGSVEISSGEFTPAWHGADIVGGTLRGILEREPRKNAEGYVIWLRPTHAIKLKQDDYMALHRIVSNLTVKEVWRQLRAGTFDEFVIALPDEFHQWALDAAEPLLTQHAIIRDGAAMWTAAVHAQGFKARKDQALYITANVLPATRGLVFSLLDGKDITDQVWRMVEPKAADGDRFREAA